MSDLGKKLTDTPYGDPYWNATGVLKGKRVVGRQLTDEEFKEYQSSLWCFCPWQFDWKNKIAWRYYAE